MRNLINRDANSFTTRRIATVLFVCLAGGALPAHTFLVALMGQRAASGFLMLMVGISLSLIVIGVMDRASFAVKLPCWLLVCFGLLPIANLVFVVANGLNTYGTISYVYIFSPYLTVFVWLWLVRREGLITLKSCIKIFALIAAVRHILVFLFPDSLFDLHISTYDFTYVYGWVGGDIPRVFGAGDEIFCLAILIYLADWVRNELSLAGAVGLWITIAGNITTMDRGNILLVLVMSGLLLSFGRRYHTQEARPGLQLSTWFYWSALVFFLAAYLLGGLAEAIPGAGERLSTDTGTFSWREKQFESAMQMQNSISDTVFGVGTQTFLTTHGKAGEGEVNGLHFGYGSVFWTFGMVGVGLLLLSLVLAVLTGGRRTLYSRDSFEWCFGLALLAILGTYSPVFIAPGTPFALTMCVAALAGSRYTLEREFFETQALYEEAQFLDTTTLSASTFVPRPEELR